MSDLSHALYGARPVTDSRLNAVVSLIFDDADHPDSKGVFCNGVLISPTKVLTAAHCIEGIGREIYEDEDPTTLVSNPGFITIKSGEISRKAKKISFSQSYFEEIGEAGEDLALIEFEKPMKALQPFKLLPKNQLKSGMKISLVAKNKIADTSLKGVKNYAQASLIFTDGRKAGVCLGDSGGAMLVEQNGEYFLAAILVFDGVGCEKRNSLGYIPKMNLK